MDVLYYALGALTLWTAALTFFLLKTIKHYKNLTSKTGAHSLEKVLDALVDQGSKHSEHIDKIAQEIKSIHDSSRSYYKKIGFVKFNPFDRVGGEQSFVIALLNDDNSGIVKTYLYTREGMRVYVKPVKDGLSSEYELSEEEKKAIKSAGS